MIRSVDFWLFDPKIDFVFLCGWRTTESFLCFLPFSETLRLLPCETRVPSVPLVLSVPSVPSIPSVPSVSSLFLLKKAAPSVFHVGSEAGVPTEGRKQREKRNCSWGLAAFFLLVLRREQVWEVEETEWNNQKSLFFLVYKLHLLFRKGGFLFCFYRFGVRVASGKKTEGKEASGTACFFSETPYEVTKYRAFPEAERRRRNA